MKYEADLTRDARDKWYVEKQLVFRTPCTSLAKNPINITVGVMTALMTYLIMFINLYMQTYYKQISGWKANKDSEFLPHCMSIVIINAK